MILKRMSHLFFSKSSLQFFFSLRNRLHNANQIAKIRLKNCVLNTNEYECNKKSQISYRIH